MKGRQASQPAVGAAFEEGEDYPELGGALRKICEHYPGDYWRKLEAEQAYPTAFITELTAGRASRFADPRGI